ncbi:MAG: hypothetical protein GY746_16855 [Gammaproteobacteria bacterium]|nr:hypothetical protein [Gammaproteobacteria bacterium]
MSNTKRCTLCKVEKYLDTDFYRYPGTDRYHSWCRDCKATQQGNDRLTSRGLHSCQIKPGTGNTPVHTITKALAW